MTDTSININRERLKIIGQAFFVTILWSSSFVIIKLGLEEISPLIFAGLRYSLASLILISIVLKSPKYRKTVYTMTRGSWINIVLYGILFYFITQGAQFLALNLIDTTTVSLVLNLTTVFVLIFAFVIYEIPSIKQIVFVLITFFGVFVYFYPVNLSDTVYLGLAIIFVGMLANAVSTLYGRSINKKLHYHPLIVTTISMSFGSILLMVSGLITEGLPRLSMVSAFYIVWLAVVNTALAFTIWNQVMREIEAVDLSVINSTMLPQIAILSIIFLGDKLRSQHWLGIGLIFISSIFIQNFRTQDKESQVDNSIHGND